MKVVARKSKMVSFRLEHEEYMNFVQTCEALGLPSVSELARTAVYRLKSTGVRPTVEQLSLQIVELRDQLTLLTCEITKLVQHIESR